VLAAVIFSALKEEKEDENSLCMPCCMQEVKEKVLKTTICNLCHQRREKKIWGKTRLQNKHRSAQHIK
jgi:hypothetical protein